MIFGRKRNQAAPDESTEQVEVDALSAEPVADDLENAEDVEQEELAEGGESGEPDEADDEEADEDESEAEDFLQEQLGEDTDLRADGPFDIDEVELGGDDVTRVDLGTLIITPWQGLNLQLQVTEGTQEVQAVTGIWQKSGIEIALFAAPASGGLARELREDAVEEAQQAGGTAELVDGPFGPELRRVLPQTGPKGEQLYHVSRVWYAEGPRWLLRGTVLGEAALGQEEAKARPFAEFFRNLVVRRGDKPMVPGDRMAMELPQAKEG